MENSKTLREYLSEYNEDGFFIYLYGDLFNIKNLPYNKKDITLLGKCEIDGTWIAL